MKNIIVWQSQSNTLKRSAKQLIFKFIFNVLRWKYDTIFRLYFTLIVPIFCMQTKWIINEIIKFVCVYSLVYVCPPVSRALSIIQFSIEICEGKSFIKYCFCSKTVYYSRFAIKRGKDKEKNREGTYFPLINVMALLLTVFFTV